MEQPILRVTDLKKYFQVRRGLLGRHASELRAVDGVSFALQPGKTMGIVGESGCGKSTLAKALLFLEKPTAGDITFDGKPVTERDAQALRRRMQIVFQDPYTSLPPRMNVRDIVAEPMRIHGSETERQINIAVTRLL